MKVRLGIPIALIGLVSLAGCFPYLPGCGHVGMMTQGSFPLLREMFFTGAIALLVYLILQPGRASMRPPAPPPVAPRPDPPHPPPGPAEPTSAAEAPAAADSGPGSPENPLDVIRLRYARGEIDRDTFETMKRDLGY